MGNTRQIYPDWHRGDSIEAVRMEQRTRQAYGDWLDTVANWDYWATLTFRDAYSVRSARRAAEHYFGEVNPKVTWWATEQGTIGGRTHLHALMEFDGYTPPARVLWNHWHNKYGRAHVDTFDKGRGAAHYVGKYVTKSFADYDLRKRDGSLL